MSFILNCSIRISWKLLWCILWSCTTTLQWSEGVKTLFFSEILGNLVSPIRFSWYRNGLCTQPTEKCLLARSLFSTVCWLDRSQLSAAAECSVFLFVQLLIVVFVVSVETCWKSELGLCTAAPRLRCSPVEPSLSPSSTRLVVSQVPWGETCSQPTDYYSRSSLR